MSEIINISGENYELNKIELESFFEIIRDEFNLKNLKDLIQELEMIKDDIIDHYPDDQEAKTLKKRLKLLDEIQYMFKGMLAPMGSD